MKRQRALTSGPMRPLCRGIGAPSLYPEKLHSGINKAPLPYLGRGALLLTDIWGMYEESPNRNIRKNILTNNREKKLLTMRMRGSIMAKYR